ncbi:unnamed protein product [Linum trigynum]|uniref:Uncharacterized protein n=1 Tax=Linum trigynum TaxID=586398 RepID=A0AAV2EPH4_9ROSI
MENPTNSRFRFSFLTCFPFSALRLSLPILFFLLPSPIFSLSIYLSLLEQHATSPPSPSSPPPSTPTPRALSSLSCRARLLPRSGALFCRSPILRKRKQWQKRRQTQGRACRGLHHCHVGLVAAVSAVSVGDRAASPYRSRHHRDAT